MLENITQVPITMFTPTLDDTCPYAVNLEQIKRIGSQVNRIDVKDEPHTYFRTSATDEWFVTNLIDQL